MKKFIAVLAAVCAVACAPKGQSEEPVAALDGKSFNVVELNGVEYVNQTETPASVSFAEGQVNATVGGNQIFAAYEEGENGAVSFSESGMTKMFVPEEFREDEFAAAFNNVAAFVLEEGVLSLKDAQGNVVIKATEVVAE
ncbi:MAG: META domain-containing protein [Bacteroidales bacterium]|nr:META domain-containing protein [Bacteroidales bacterium]